IHFLISAPGYDRLVTHVFVKGDKYLDSDAVFGVRNSLVRDYTKHPPGRAPNGTMMAKPFYTLNYDFVMRPPTTKAAKKRRAAK
ncbi:MAG: hydroxyquinol 1,2-dioxygenase, partial [Burkholderiales bacterium]